MHFLSLIKYSWSKNKKNYDNLLKTHRFDMSMIIHLKIKMNIKKLQGKVEILRSPIYLKEKSAQILFLFFW